MTTTDPTTTPTTDPTETAILEALRGGEFALGRDPLPDTRDHPGHRETALHRLWRSGRVSVVHVRGRNFIALSDNFGPTPVHLVAA